MRKFLIGLFALAACSAPPSQVQRESIAFNGPGSTPVSIYNQCSAVATRQCPSLYTIACQSYHRAFNRGCMIQNGVSADYIALLVP